MHRFVLLSVFLLMSQSAWSFRAQADSATVAVRFDALANKMKVRQPKLKADEYQVRLWVKVSLAYGDAQKLVVLDKKPNSLVVSEYEIVWDKYTFDKAKCIRNKAEVDTMVWQKLLADGLLTLSDQSMLKEQLFPKRSPRDTTVAVRVDSLGAVTVTAKKTESYVFISDGVHYRFDILGANSRRSYDYHCPAGYARVRTKVVELKKVVSLLTQIFTLFGGTSDICAISQPQTFAWL